MVSHSVSLNRVNDSGSQEGIDSLHLPNIRQKTLGVMGSFSASWRATVSRSRMYTILARCEHMSSFYLHVLFEG